jgi:hypothetical protein
MKSRFVVQSFVAALLMSAVIFFLVSCSQSGGPNWKIYYKNEYGDFYYDKNSIHYPITKKTIFGLTVKDKNIVNVWTRRTDKHGNSDPWLERLYCAERERDGDSPPPYPGELRAYRERDNPKEPIEPGSENESLLNKVCFNKGEELTPTDTSQMQERPEAPKVEAPVAMPAPANNAVPSAEPAPPPSGW